LPYFIFKKTLSGASYFLQTLFLVFINKNINKIMKHKLKVFFAFFLILSAQQFYAQDIVTTQKAQDALAKKADREAKKSTDEIHKKLNDEQARLKKEQKTVENHQKDLKNSEKNLEKTKQKISKLESENQKINTKINTNSLTAEESQKQAIKVKQKELEIQKLKLKQIDQQKNLDKVRASL